jgi:hypothetical protein
VIGLTGEVEPPAPVRPNRARHANCCLPARAGNPSNCLPAAGHPSRLRTVAGRSYRWRGVLNGQRSPLLDVKLHESADSVKGFVVPAEFGRIPAGGGQRLGQGDAIAVPQSGRPFGGHRPGDDPAARAGDAEAGAFLIDEIDDADRPGRPETGRLQGLDRGQRADHTQRSVERPAIRN